MKLYLKKEGEIKMIKYLGEKVNFLKTDVMDLCLFITFIYLVN